MMEEKEEKWVFTEHQLNTRLQRTVLINTDILGLSESFITFSE